MSPAHPAYNTRWTVWRIPWFRLLLPVCNPFCHFERTERALHRFFLGM